MTQKKLYQAFPITSVSRADLENEGFDVSKVSDNIMERLAYEMANSYVQNSFWIDLGIIAEDLGIPQVKKIKKHEAN